jgi:hypothetical protein
MNNTPQSYDDLIQIAADGVRQLQNPEEVKRWISHQPFFPSNVPVKDGFVFITSEGYSALKRLGQTWYANEKIRSKLLSQAAAEKLAVSAFGELLDQANNLPAEADTKRKLLRIMDERLKGLIQPEYFYFPAHVFEQTEVGTFAIGPVIFYRRVDWLDAVEKIEGTSISWKIDVLDRWERRQNRLRQVLDSLGDWLAGEVLRQWPSSWLARRLVKARLHQSYVDDIVKAVGTCDWIMVVAIEGRERSRSADCASVAGLVALDSLGLSMRMETARNLRGPGHDASRKLRYD